MKSKFHRCALLSSFALSSMLSGACGERGTSEHAPPGEPSTAPDRPTEPGQPVNVAFESAKLRALDTQLSSVEAWGPEDLLRAYPVQFENELGFDPTAALNYDLIQASTLALTEAEQALFAANGVVISAPQRFATFSYGYHSVYAADLPVFISADSVLDALHRSYDDILKGLEQEVLIGIFEQFLAGMRANAANSTLPDGVRRDVDFFLAVSQSLLGNRVAAPGFEGSYTLPELQKFVDAATAAEGIIETELFGVLREIDFSQFKPRGHYTDSEELSRYFRAMMWMGRIDLRLVETLGDGQRVLRRRQVGAMLAFHDLLNDPLRAAWNTIDRTITGFVGEHDYMNLSQVDALKSALGISNVAELERVSDDELTRVILDGAYGEQRIASHVIRKVDVFGPTLPLNASFALFGQRYVLDSHVFSQVVYDRVEQRVVPNPLDAAFAALGNNQAAHLLRGELERYPFAANLGAMRILADEHPESSWSSSLYTMWLGALRELSAGEAPAGSAAAAQAEVASPVGSGLPAVAKTEVWGRRLLNTQLGSWSQLRHDTLLYAKQSYTTSDACEFPDAYVEPYPGFWAKLLLLAEQGSQLLVELNVGQVEVIDRALAYFQRFSSIVGVLERMSRAQLSGMPHTAEDVAFINDAVRISSGGSGPPTIEGWYHQLLFDPYTFGDVDNIVADVHTDPGGMNPPRDPSVLHVGTNYPRLMVLAVETCEGPRAYAGPVYDYEEYLAPGLKRYDDEEWVELLQSATPPPDVPWMAPLQAQK